VKREWEDRQVANWNSAYASYQWALDKGIAKECARAVLPLQVKTKLFINATMRSWVHYLASRTDPSTQKEHRDIAKAVQALCIQEFPIIAEAAGWVDEYSMLVDKAKIHT